MPLKKSPARARRSSRSSRTFSPAPPSTPRRWRSLAAPVAAPDTSALKIRRLRAKQRLYLGFLGGAGALALLLSFVATRSTRLWAGLETQPLEFSPQNGAISSHFVLSTSGDVWRFERRGDRLSARRFWLGEFPSQVAPVETPAEFSSAFKIAPCVAIASLDGSLAVLDAQNGALQWRRALGSAVATRPLWGENPPKNGENTAPKAALFAADDHGDVVSFDANSGRENWRTRVAGVPGAALVRAQNRLLLPVLAADGSRGGLLALESATGQLAWRFPRNPRHRAAGVGAPLFDAASRRIFWANDEGAIFCLDARNGAKIWKSFAAPLSSHGAERRAISLRATPVLWRDLLITGANDGGVRAFDARTGAPKWSVALREPILNLEIANLQSGAAHSPLRGEKLVVSGAETAILSPQNGEIFARGEAGTLHNSQGRLALWSQAGVWRPFP